MLLALVVPNTRILLPLGLICMFLTYMFIGVFINFDELPKNIISISNYLPIKYMTNNFFDVWVGHNLWNNSFLQLNTIWMLIIISLIIVTYYFKYRR